MRFVSTQEFEIDDEVMLEIVNRYINTENSLISADDIHVLTSTDYGIIFSWASNKCYDLLKESMSLKSFHIKKL